MIFVFVAPEIRLKYFRSTVMSGMLDEVTMQDHNKIESTKDTWIFIEPSRNWINKVKGIKFDRIYLCRNFVRLTSHSRTILFSLVRDFNIDNIVVI